MQRISLVAMVSLGVIGSVVGCGGGSADYKKAEDIKKAPAIHDDHDHGAKGPHGGSLVELGDEEYHAEVILDHDAHALAVYLLGKDAKSVATTTAAEVTLALEGKDSLTLKAAPQAGDDEGKASKFELVDDKVVHDLLDSKMIHAELRVTIGDKPYSGHVDYHLDDAHHDHKEEAKKEETKPVDGEKKDEASKPEGESK